MKLASLSLLCCAFLFSTTSVNAQTTHTDHATSTTAAEHVHYTCPMHPEVITEAPGKCPKCGMDLVKKDTPMAKAYTCPMHPEVMSDKPANCPKCDMAMEEKKQPMAMMFACPMHPDETSDKPGKCAMCGMDMEKKK